LEARASFLLLLGTVNTAYRKTSCIEIDPIRSLRFSELRSHGTDRRDAVQALRSANRYPAMTRTRCPASRAYPFFTMSRMPPHRCGGTDYPSSFGHAFARGDRQRSGGARRDRTDDLLLAKQALSQLSYGPLRHGPFVPGHAARPCGHLPSGCSFAETPDHRGSGGPGKI
jgi:hypothetical protein